MSEFNLIEKYFTRPAPQADLGVGDDAALVRVSAGMQLAVSTDMLVAGTHFFHDAAPYDIGWKALAVNISDMAAMGAQAKWATLAIALPKVAAPSPQPSPTGGEGVLSAGVFTLSSTRIALEIDTTQGCMTEDELSKPATVTPSPLMGEGWGEGEIPQSTSITEHWLAEFSRGFFACADTFNVDLIGGDTTKGPLNICVTIMGEVPIGQALSRSGAQAGDDIWVSGTLGDAALALAVLQNRYKIDANWQGVNVEGAIVESEIFEKSELQKWLPSLNRPQPRAALGLALRSIATSCIDVSDGLLADLGHILTASRLGADLHLESLPVSLYNLNHLHDPLIQQCVLAGGDDYELCFTAPKAKREEIELIGKQQNLALSRIAATRSAIGLQAYCQNKPITLLKPGFDHFA